MDENAALIAEHLEAAGDLHAAFGRHMRAGTWLTHRDLTAARASWQRARHVADRLADDDAERSALRIAPRTLRCASAWLSGGSMADTGFDELRELAIATGDQVSLGMGMAGRHGDEVSYQDFRDRYRTMAKSLGFEGHIAMADAMT